MLPLWRKARDTLSGPFLGALLLAAGFFAFVGWDQSHWWRIKPDYGFGWVVPLFVGFVLRERWPTVAATAAACAAEGSPRASGLGKWLLRFIVAMALLGGAGMFLLGAFHRAGSGTSQPGTLAITLGAVAIVFPLLFVNAPESPRPAAAPLWSDARLPLVGLFIFPVCVWLISAPLVSAVETQLNLFLLRRIVTIVAGVFEALSLPIEQQGNVLELPSGKVGVEEACAGIRSLTGCLFAGSFVTAVFLTKLRHKIALLAMALGLALLGNLLRSLFLTAWAYRYGPAAIEGTVHDAAGFAALALTLAGLIPAVRWLKRERRARARPAVATP